MTSPTAHDIDRARNGREQGIQSESSKRAWSAALKHSAVGIELVVSMAVGYGVGRFADRRLGTSPWWTVIGFVCGCAAGFRAIFRVARAYRRETEGSEDER